MYLCVKLYVINLSGEFRGLKKNNQAYGGILLTISSSTRSTFVPNLAEIWEQRDSLSLSSTMKPHGICSGRTESLYPYAVFFWNFKHFFNLCFNTFGVSIFQINLKYYAETKIKHKSTLLAIRT